MAEVSAAGAGAGAIYGKAIMGEDGKPKIGQLVGGIDFLSQISELEKAQKSQAEPLNLQISKNASKVIPEIELLKNKTKAFRDAANELTNNLGVAQRGENVFRERILEGYASDGSLLHNYIQAVPSSNAPINNQPVSMKVNQLARYDRISSISSVQNNTNTPICSSFEPLNYTDTLYLSIGGQSASLTVTPSMSLQDLTNAVNMLSPSIAINAGIIKSGEDSLRVILTGTTLSEVINVSSSGSILNFLGFTTSNSVSSGHSSSDLVSQITVNGVSVTRKSNTFNDVGGPLTGASLTLKQPSSALLSFNLDYNREKIFSSIKTFIDKYNDLYNTITKNQQTADDGEPSPDAYLFGNALLQQLKSQILVKLNTVVPGLERDDFNVLEKVGITNRMSKNPTNPLYLNTNTLKETLVETPSKILKLFGNFYSSTNNNFRLWNLPDSLNPKLAGIEITVSLTNSQGTQQMALSSELGTEIMPFENSLLEPPSNSLYKGIHIGYKGQKLEEGESVQTLIKFSQGIAPPLVETLNAMLTERQNPSALPTNIFEIAVDQIVQSNSALKNRVDEIIKNADEVVKRLNMQVSRVYKISNKSKGMMEMIEAYKAVISGHK